MGWLFQPGATRTGLIDYLTGDRSWDSANGEAIIERRCVAKYFVGAIRFRGTLWAVLNHTRTEQDGTVQRFPNYIMCFLMRCENSKESGHGWGYKDMTEADEPCETSCPIRYLELCPYTAVPAWRNRVYSDYASHIRRRRRVKRKPRAVCDAP